MQAEIGKLRLPRATRRVLTSSVLLTLLCGNALYVRAQTPPQISDLASRAAVARDAGNIPLAVDLYSQAEKLQADWKEGWWYLGVLQYSSGQFAGGIDAFTHLLQLVPTAAPAMALRGLCEFETRAFDDSLRDLASSVEVRMTAFCECQRSAKSGSFAYHPQALPQRANIALWGPHEENAWGLVRSG